MSDRIHVAIRVRPLNSREQQYNEAWQFDEKTITGLSLDTGRPTGYTYSFGTAKTSSWFRPTVDFAFKSFIFCLPISYFLSNILITGENNDPTKKCPFSFGSFPVPSAPY
jgi:hypothetical protein